MKYLEQFGYGDTFSFEGKLYILTSDFKVQKDHTQLSCINLKTGHSRWISANSIVDAEPIYRLDNDNNIIPIKESKKDVE